ncbi:UNVERIFIED_CONTAM: hypothetical protein Scaly_2204100 [Sesamum calycinum]|uniref:Retrotransposon gag domain-containing protein n=1 Tax=Sesamum calycinum TaxID=2727403 RepID=A0AAW2MSG3_9LAMI
MLEFEESSRESEEEVIPIVPERTINDMTSPDLNQQPLCIEYPDLEVNFELKSGLVHLLPTFRGLAGEDPHKHLKEFHVLCSGMRPQGITEEQIKLRAFSFSLAEQAKDWLYFLPSGSITTWNDLKKQQFGTRYDDPPRKSNEVSIAAFDDRLNELTSLVKKIAVERIQHVKAYCICTLTRNATDMCPTLQESPTEHAEAIGEFFGQQHRRYDPFSNTYNPGWKDHPNLSYSAQNQNFQRSQYRSHVPSPPSNPEQGTSLEDMITALISNTQQIQQNTQQ